MDSKPHSELIAAVRKALVDEQLRYGEPCCAICGAALPGHQSDCDFKDSLPAFESLLEQYQALRDAAESALVVLHDPRHTWLPAAEILSVALTSNPATSSGKEPVSRREVAGVSVPEASSPASEPKP